MSTSFNFFIIEEDQLRCQQILRALAASGLGSSLPRVIQETLAIFATGEWNENCHNEKCRASISVLKSDGDLEDAGIDRGYKRYLLQNEYIETYVYYCTQCMDRTTECNCGSLVMIDDVYHCWKCNRIVLEDAYNKCCECVLLKCAGCDNRCCIANDDCISFILCERCGEEYCHQCIRIPTDSVAYKICKKCHQNRVGECIKCGVICHYRSCDFISCNNYICYECEQKLHGPRKYRFLQNGMLVLQRDFYCHQHKQSGREPKKKRRKLE